MLGKSSDCCRMTAPQSAVRSSTDRFERPWMLGHGPFLDVETWKESSFPSLVGSHPSSSAEPWRRTSPFHLDVLIFMILVENSWGYGLPGRLERHGHSQCRPWIEVRSRVSLIFLFRLGLTNWMGFFSCCLFLPLTPINENTSIRIKIR